LFPWNDAGLVNRYLFPLQIRLFWSRNTYDDEDTLVSVGPEDHDLLRAIYKENFNRFQASELGKRFKALVKPLFEDKERTINKIVAFGGMGLAVGSPKNRAPGEPVQPFILTPHFQHSALEVMRDLWKENNADGRKLEIYLQDPQYTSMDNILATECGMTIVNCRPGHQLGWLHLDKHTVVVDWIACFPVAELALEITRPAAFLSTWNYDTPQRMQDSWACAVEEDGQEIKCPMFGR
jgi:hypothetical protein